MRSATGDGAAVASLRGQPTATASTPKDATMAQRAAKAGKAPPPSHPKRLLRDFVNKIDQATMCRGAAVALALLAHLPALYESDLRAVLDPADASEVSAFEALRACVMEVDNGGARRPMSCVMTYALSGSGVFTKRLVNVLLHGRVAWRAFDVAHGITGDACAALAGVGLVLCAHPLHAECVSWTGARPLLLATCLALEAVKRSLAGDARLGAAFTFMACAAHAAAAGAPALAFAARGDDLVPSILAACLGAWLFLGVDGSRAYDAQAPPPRPIQLPPREWYAGCRDGLASLAWYLASFIIPPENPPALNYALFDRAQLSHPSLASQRTLYASLALGLLILLVTLRRRHAARVALRYAGAFTVTVVIASAGIAGGVTDRVAYLPSIVVACALSIGVAYCRGRGPAVAPHQELYEDSEASSSNDETPRQRRRRGAPSGLARVATDCCVALAACCAGLQALRGHVRAQPYASELALFRAATRAAPDDAQAWHELGDVFRASEDLDEPWFRDVDAMRAYEAAVDAGREPEPCGLLALRAPAVPSIIASCYEARADVLGRGSRRGVMELFEAAKWHSRAGDFRKSTRHLLKVKRAFANCDLWVQVGLARRGRGQLEPAVEAYANAVELDPGCVGAYQNWGNLELGRENRPRALELFRRELELDPSHRSRFEDYARDPDILALLNNEPSPERPVPPPVQPPADPPEEAWSG